MFSYDVTKKANFFACKKAEVTLKNSVLPDVKYSIPKIKFYSIS